MKAHGGADNDVENACTTMCFPCTGWFCRSASLSLAIYRTPPAPPRHPHRIRHHGRLQEQGSKCLFSAQSLRTEGGKSFLSDRGADRKAGKLDVQAKPPPPPHAPTTHTTTVSRHNSNVASNRHALCLRSVHHESESNQTLYRPRRNEHHRPALRVSALPLPFLCTWHAPRPPSPSQSGLSERQHGTHYQIGPLWSKQLRELEACLLNRSQPNMKWEGVSLLNGCTPKRQKIDRLWVSVVNYLNLLKISGNAFV